MKWTNDDIAKVEKFIDMKNKGYYCDGKELTELYNRVLERKVAVTNCGSCLRLRVNELEAELNKYKMLLEQSKNDEVDNSSEEENKANREAGKAQKSKAIKKVK